MSANHCFFTNFNSHQMKYAVTLALVCLCSAAVAQVTTNVQWTRQSSLPAAEVIYYDEAKKLAWDNFKAEPQEKGIVAAVTFSGFGYIADIKSIAGKSQLNIKVYCYFNKNKSWVNPAKASPYILKHEQHHFDISYIAAGIFIDRLQNTVFSQSDYKTMLPKIYQDCIDFMGKMQDDYDRQTKNGQQKDKQEEWGQKIKAMIKQTDAVNPA
jgi:hypothetical protein